ncbi:phosphatase 2C-like domain-containing protein [Crassisporium funariophilum]|nr:phosphatase 2C-like domain-containing protein [Crassisporium funariophilum]
MLRNSLRCSTLLPPTRRTSHRIRCPLISRPYSSNASRYSLSRHSKSILIILGLSTTAFVALNTINADASDDKSTTTPSSVEGRRTTASKLVPDVRNMNVLGSHKHDDIDSLFDLLSLSASPEKKTTGMGRIDQVIVPSNKPCEDYAHFLSVNFHGGLDYTFFGVYDGHNGTATSRYLHENLILAILGAFADLYSTHRSASTPAHVDVEGRFSFIHPEQEVDGDQSDQRDTQPQPSSEELDATIKEVFLKVDDEIVNTAVERVLGTLSPSQAPLSRSDGGRLLAPATAGSCAVVAVLNNLDRILKVALTGDSRAVLGRRVPVKDKHGKISPSDGYIYEVHVLSADQNAHNPKEKERMEALHPGETIMDKGRVLGWGMSRAFGDASYKWSRDIQQRLYEEYLGDRPRDNCVTPPYFTAEPEITTTKVQKGDFLVLASDGLWDCLADDEVVGLIGGWLETRGIEGTIETGKGVGESEIVLLPPDKVGPSGMSPIKGFGKGKGNGWAGLGGKPNDEDGAETIWERSDLPVNSLQEDKTVMYRWWRTTKRFVNVDENAAVHLARNALGGVNKDLTKALFQLEPPRSRRYRDDISVQVVFFD